MSTPPGWDFGAAIAEKRAAMTAVFGRSGITFDPSDGPAIAVSGAVHSGTDFEDVTPGALYSTLR